MDDWLNEDKFGPQEPKPTGKFQSPLVARRFSSWAYTKMDPDSIRLGSVRQGRVLWGEPQRSRRGCRAGWYALAQGGYACAGGSFRTLEEPEPASNELGPELDAALPYEYVRVSAPGAPRYDRIPTPDEEASLSVAGAAQAPLDVRMVGDYFLAIDGLEVDRGRRFYRTLQGKYVRFEDVQPLPPTGMHGAKNPALPLAFVIVDGAPVFSLDGDEEERQPVGAAARHARFPVRRTDVRRGEPLVVGPDELALPAAAVRVARRLPPPAEVSPREKWIHVDLSEQTLVAYEGKTPVLATLVSSGKPGHDTPTGTWRIRDKLVSTTMRGRDPVDGRYEVEEVPWTMFYHRGYALHGAYWHDDLGNVRSHGCTNLAPADARWLVRWTDPPLPEGWHSIRAGGERAGTRIVITS